MLSDRQATQCIARVIKVSTPVAVLVSFKEIHTFQVYRPILLLVIDSIIASTLVVLFHQNTTLRVVLDNLDRLQPTLLQRYMLVLGI
jgi:hypothetical protein